MELSGWGWPAPDRIDTIGSDPATPSTVTNTMGAEQDLQLQRKLQQDSILLAGRTIYLNPFLYWRRFDANTDRWLREPGQLAEEQIQANRLRFYPELSWDQLEADELAIKDGAVEMFLKTLELISTFNPELTAGQLLEVERKMAITKKRAFERWVGRALRRRESEAQRQRRRFDRERVLRGWGEWLGHEGTRHALLPLTAVMVLVFGAGWWFGSQACRQQVVAPAVERPQP